MRVRVRVRGRARVRVRVCLEHLEQVGPELLERRVGGGHDEARPWGNALSHAPPLPCLG